MTSFPAEPIRLTRSKTSGAAGVLSRAFVGDPFVRRLFPDSERRERHFARTATCVLKYALDRGEVQAVSPALEGVAVWFPPSGFAPTWWDELRCGVFALPLTIGFGSTRMLLRYANHTAAMRKRHLRGPYWFLQLLAVDPVHRGDGHGGFLLRSMLDRLDRLEMPCCLDTENEKNVALYEHFGFRVLESSKIPGTDCDCWLMARDSR
jgi:ribosomal protein S18 acetylase RimI-like enzyme